MTHRCAAYRCNMQVPDNMLMCRPHWFKVPKALRDGIWETYRRGPTAEYRANVREAIRVVAEKEGRLRPSNVEEEQR